MGVERGTPIPFRNDGVRFSYVPRDRGMERQNAPIENGQQYFDAMEREGANTAYYVILTNRSGTSPDSSYREIRGVFRNQGSIVSSIPLDGEDGAIFDLMGFTTAPYAAGEGETHFLCFVTRNGSVPTFGELSPEEMMNLHKIIGHSLDYLEHMSPLESKSYIGFSFSPLESRRVAMVSDPTTGKEETILFPRSPVQNIATIHGHLVTLKPDHLHPEPNSKKLFDERMMREPKLEALTDIFRTAVFEPVMEQFTDISVAYAEHTGDDNAFPKGSFLMVDREEIKNPRFGQLIHALHQQAERVYYCIADSIVHAENLYKGEVILRSPGEIRSNLDQLFSTYPFENLPSQAQSFLKLFTKMKDPNVMAPPHVSFGEREKIAESFVILGLAYNMVYYYPDSHPDKAVVAIEPRWMSGASPTETMGIFKDQNRVSTEEFAPIHKRNMDAAKGLGAYLATKCLFS